MLLDSECAMNTMNRRAAGLALVATLALLFAGCGGPKNFTPDDFKQVQPGTTEEQVYEALGKPSSTTGSGANKALWYAVGGNYYVIGVKDGKVSRAEQCRSKAEYDGMRSYAK
jgi:outer membrane protein assembly factor BamE (lipoprotein component of BamABCDE complex)